MILRAQKVVYNWHYTHEQGEDYCVFEEGKAGIKELLVYGTPEMIYAKAIREDGSVILQYNINRIIYKPTEVKND